MLESYLNPGYDCLFPNPLKFITIIIPQFVVYIQPKVVHTHKKLIQETAFKKRETSCMKLVT